MGERSYEKGESVSRDGLTVHQLYTETEFDVPSVVLKLVSSREEAAFVRLVVPDLKTDRIGFHSDFEGDSWAVEDGRLVFEADIDPDSDLTTLYAVESGTAESIGAAMESLQIAVVEPLDSEPQESDQLLGGDEAPTDDPLDESGFEAIVEEDDETLIETEEELDIGTDPDETLVNPDEIDPAESDDSAESETDIDETETETAFDETEREPTAGSVEFEEQLDDLGTGDDEPPEPDSAERAESDGEQAAGDDLASVSTGELVSELTARLDSEELTPQQRRSLRTAGVETRGDARDEQISNLQARVSDVETFTDSIERLFDAYGPPEEVFEEYDEQLDRLESRVEELDTLEGSLDGVEQRIQRVEDSVETVEDSVTEVEDSVESVEETVEDVETEVQETSDTVEEIQENQATIESEIEDLKRWRKKITNALQAIMGE